MTECLRASLVALVAMIAAAPLHAEHLPLRNYRNADGLPHERVKCIERDSSGFLWFCTVEGLARFDGSRFTRYGVDDGLPVPSVNSILETSPGIYWIATNGGGVVRFDAARRQFTALRITDEFLSNRVNTLARGHDGRLWVGTDDGLFSVDAANPGATPHREDAGDLKIGAVFRLLAASDGSLWIGSSKGVVRFGENARARCRFHTPVDTAAIRWLTEDASGRIWIGHDAGVTVLRSAPMQHGVLEIPGIEVPTTIRSVNEAGPIEPAPGTAIEVQSADGAGAIGMLPQRPGDVWIGARSGTLLRFDGQRFTRYTPRFGLPDSDILSIASDIEGNLWLGTLSDGAVRLTSGGFVTYGREDGLSNPRIYAVVPDRRGRIVVVTGDGALSRFDEGHFAPLRSGLSRPLAMNSGLWQQFLLQTHTGDWWFRAPDAAYRVRSADDAPASLIGPVRVSEPPHDVQRLFEDTRGRVWIGSLDSGGALAEWDSSAGVRVFTAADGVPAWGWPTTFAEDRFGGVWIGFYQGGVARYADGRFQVWGATDGVPGGTIRAIYRDRLDRLWIAGARGGLARVAGENGPRPRFEGWTTARGMASNNARAIAEDAWGRLYVGTEHGVDRLDIVTGHIRHYTTADGLASNEIEVALTDQRGDLWFGTAKGLSRLTPAPDRAKSPPPIWITGVRIGVRPLPVGALGASAVAVPALGPADDHVEIAFGGLEFSTEGAIRYEYRLEGIDRDWLKAGVARSVTYGRLGTGRYRFVARAVAEDGAASASPAVVEFVVLPPIWLRWWFLTLAMAALAAAAFQLHRYRLARLVELERVRLRIAVDLHDDIGASLSQIAVLSEVTRRRARGGRHDVDQPLARIAATSREVVDAMGDIVWAINPQRDSLDDLTYRVRRFANDVLGARNVRLRFVAPAGAVRPLGLDLKRQLFLVLKEAINNIARHADCTEASIELRLDGGRFVLEVRDNGRGFDSSAAGAGHGLASMKRRIEALGGRLDLTSSPGSGTQLIATVPERHHRVRRYLSR